MRNVTLALQQMEMLCFNGLNLQRMEVFEFAAYKGLYGNETALLEKTLFVNKFYLPCYRVVFFVVCQFVRPM